MPSGESKKEKVGLTPLKQSKRKRLGGAVLKLRRNAEGGTGRVKQVYGRGLRKKFHHRTIYQPVSDWEQTAYSWLGGKEVLSFRSGSKEGWIRLETDGVPLEAVRHALEKRVFSQDEIRSVVGVTGSLREVQGLRLSRENSARFLRLARIKAKAQEVFGGRMKAHRWIHAYNPTLGALPLELLTSEQGARLVEDEINRIDWGVFI